MFIVICHVMAYLGGGAPILLCHLAVPPIHGPHALPLALFH